MGYKHLAREQRYAIEALLQTPMSLCEIGEVIGVSKGTVSREIGRNCDMRGHRRYRWPLDQKKYERRMKTRKHFLKFTDEEKRRGDFEIDTIIGKNRKGAIMTTNDRCTHLVLIRQYIPRGTDFSELTDEMIAEIEWKLNNRPRKSLGYLTPIEYCKLMFNFDFGVRCTSNRIHDENHQRSSSPDRP